MPMDIPEWRNVDRHLFETQILPAGRPAVFKGAVDNWPLVQRRTDSPAEIIDYLKSFNPATQVEWIAGDPQTPRLAPFNILINYWWNSARRPLTAPFLCLLHGAIAAAHIAREQRGLLGSLSPEQAAQSMAVLMQLLSGAR